ncbi:MAG TPA: fumarylacetoacetate hydrolase family protein [Terriglobales bacterium]|nr:fumarylacetoacetate hydrolase family protein [Terriglobales bacterium]
MKYCRFESDGQPQYGLVESIAGHEQIIRVLAASPQNSEDLEDIPTRRIEPISLDKSKLLVPVEPSKIICVGRNYREHASELGNEVPTEPLLFFKPPSSLLNPGENIVRPRISTRTDYEGELGLVIGRRCRNLGPDEDVKPYILGYTAVNDFTARDIQKKDGQWTRGKGFDTFCPVGPLVSNEIDPWAGITVETRVDGEIRQHGTTRDFIFPLDVILRYITAFMTLLPGDLIATGTPAGVGPVTAGSVVEVTVEGVGTLRNPIVDETQS